MNFFDEQLLAQMKAQPPGTNLRAVADKLYNKALALVLKKPWAVGYRDQGMGHGTYGVILKKNGELLFPNLPQEIAQHLVDLHNATLKKKPS